ncbi:bifunctional diguanylate cyclase/phosphodiesterase [Eilatimonas milleporae]|uniref:Diguanylate cyclase (GGDEF)-like protein n=1 Tax=Eilatimonas milleporae TaxID=911205 RepID=A0A3M0C724_9PROT|nr:EAL domain-containing protein [Eilatimonas milleporae]RMB04497.1 diguanylate cyclase (GGDEF)-like protein [Eilatimonas milleporae]
MNLRLSGVSSSGDTQKGGSENTATGRASDTWKLLIVDDEPEIHTVTQMALARFQFGGKRLSFLNAYSAAEAAAMIEANPDIAVAIIDVVMETDDAGLRLVEQIRNEMGNGNIRIILRTGQPGQAPERSVIAEYDINDYKEKTELTAQKLFTAMYAALRAYRDIRALDINRMGLKSVIEASAAIFKTRALSNFAQGVLEQLTSLLFLEPEAVYCHADGLAAVPNDAKVEIVAATGRFAPFVGRDGKNVLDPDILEAIENARRNRSHRFEPGKIYIAYFRTESGSENILCVKGDMQEQGKTHELLDLFCRNVSIAFENLHLQDNLLTEITVREEAEKAAEILARLPAEAPNPVLRISSDGVILYANGRSSPLLDVWGAGVGQKIPPVWRHRLKYVFKSGRQSEIEVTCDDRIFELTMAPVVEADYVNIYGRDITESKRAQERVEYMAHHDALTHLPNRFYFQERLPRELEAARRSGKKVALLQIDLDMFKEVNDVYGHDVGDLLLKDVSTRLKETVRSCDTVVRLGGDEFAVIAPDLGELDSAAILAQRIVDCMAAHFRYDKTVLQVGCSIGITTFPDDSLDPTELQKNADLAMYQAKDDGRNTYHFYDAVMHERILERRFLENEIRHALDNDKLDLYYQPKISFESGRIVGAEALIRWHHPDRGMIPPMEFIPIAERCGLISRIGEWVLETACAQAQRWRQAGLGLDNIAVNVSAAQFRNGDLGDIIDRILQSTGLEPEILELEITETTVMQEMDIIVEMLASLKKLGVGVAIDDFGTGYSSLAYLRRLPLTKIKIDRSFVTDILENQDASVVANAIISLGHSLNLKLVAEGIEKPDQAAFLAEKGCQEGQGYLFGRPMPSEDFQALLAAGQVYEKN